MGTSKRRRRHRQPGRLGAYVGVAALAAVVVALAAYALQPTQTTASGSPSPMFTSPPAPTEEPPVEIIPRPTLEEVQSLVRDAAPLIVSVLGDSTSNDGNEWVFIWAHHLADQGATVTIHSWDAAIDTYPEPQVFGEGDRAIEIWNGSIPGQNADAALDLIDALQPVAPSLLILNYGHNHGKNPVGTSMQNLTVSTDERWGTFVPVVAMLQNPAVDNYAETSQQSHDSTASWAAEHGVPTVDVTSTFLANPNWATEFLYDTVHPNSTGSIVWADTVIQTIG